MDGVKVLCKSPRMQTSAWMTVRPPRMMFCVPWIWDFRETLLPVSCGDVLVSVGFRRDGLGITVSIYSPLTALGGIATLLDIVSGFSWIWVARG